MLDTSSYTAFFLKELLDLKFSNVLEFELYPHKHQIQVVLSLK